MKHPINYSRQAVATTNEQTIENNTGNEKLLKLVFIEIEIKFSFSFTEYRNMYLLLAPKTESMKAHIISNLYDLLLTLNSKQSS